MEEEIEIATMKYKMGNANSIKLFGEDFIKNNKNNCKIIIEKKEQDIIEFLNVNKSEELLKIKLKEIKTITNMSYIFSKCKSLISFDISIGILIMLLIWALCFIVVNH